MSVHHVHAHRVLFVSVGLVVSEMRTADGVDQRLDSKTLQYLKDEALEFDGNDELAALAADEVEEENKAKKENKNMKTDRAPLGDERSGIANGERFICYMCYETHDTAEDPLVAPCECRGGE